MSNEKAIAKIEKAATKGKSSVIIKLLVKGDKEVVLKSLEALGKIDDEDSRNHITHFLDHEDKEIRLTACRSALVINTEYMRTRVRHQLAMEKDAEVKALIQEAFNNARTANV